LLPAIFLQTPNGGFFTPSWFPTPPPPTSSLFTTSPDIFAPPRAQNP